MFRAFQKIKSNNYKNHAFYNCLPALTKTMSERQSREGVVLRLTKISPSTM